MIIEMKRTMPGFPLPAETELSITAQASHSTKGTINTSFSSKLNSTEYFLSHILDSDRPKPDTKVNPLTSEKFILRLYDSNDYSKIKTKEIFYQKEPVGLRVKNLTQYLNAGIADTINWKCKAEINPYSNSSLYAVKRTKRLGISSSSMRAL